MTDATARILASREVAAARLLARHVVSIDPQLVALLVGDLSARGDMTTARWLAELADLGQQYARIKTTEGAE